MVNSMVKVLPLYELGRTTSAGPCRNCQLTTGGCSVCREHLGLLSGKSSVDVSDPVSSAFYKGVWMKRATINTSVYEKVGALTYLSHLCIDQVTWFLMYVGERSTSVVHHLTTKLFCSTAKVNRLLPITTI